MNGVVGKGNDNEVMIDDRLLLDDNTSVAVGFRDENSVKFLENILLKVFKKDEYERQKNHKQFMNQMEKQEKAAQKRHEENQKNDKSANVENQLKKLNAEEKSRTKIIEAYLKTFVGVVSQAYSKSLQSSSTLAETFRKIDQSGVTVVGGMDAVTKSAYNLGMSYDEITANLSKLSPIIAKLNGTMGNGLQAYDKALSNIPKSLSLSHEEQNAVFEATMNGMTASQLKSINSQEELNKRVVDTAKEMKLLKIVTGKSIEALKEENNARMQEARFKQFEARFGSDTMAILKSVFKNDNAIEWLLTGGTAHAGEMATLMANSPGLQKALPEIMQLVQSGNLTAEAMLGIASKYQGQLTTKGAMARNFAGHAGHMAAAGLSSSYQNMVFNTDIEDSLLSLLTNPQEIMNSESYKQSQEMLNNAQRYKEGWNKWNVAWTDAQAGRTEGASKLLGMSGKVVNMGADTAWWMNEHTGDGVLKALASSATKDALPRAGEWLMAKGSQAFASLFSGSKWAMKQKDKAIHNMDKNVEKVVELLEEGLNTTGGQGSQGESSNGKTIGTFISGMASSIALWKWKPLLLGLTKMAVPIASTVVAVAGASYGIYRLAKWKNNLDKTSESAEISMTRLRHRMTREEAKEFNALPKPLQEEVLTRRNERNMFTRDALKEVKDEYIQTGMFGVQWFKNPKTSELLRPETAPERAKREEDEKNAIRGAILAQKLGIDFVKNTERTAKALEKRNLTNALDGRKPAESNL